MRALTLGLAAVLAAAVAVRYAEPILDGDLFFHLAYARQILERGTLQPDHALYAWTPASNAMIYCAWASELVLYGLWRVLGLPGLFALRYAVIGGVVLLLWWHARRVAKLTGGAATVALTFTILALVAVGSRAGSLVKPELFSLLFLHLVLWLYARAKTDRRLARGLWWAPAILVAWVNSHGGFILLAPFLALSALGELLNRWVSPGCALSRAGLRHLLGAWTLCAAAILVTPYGLRYPWQLVDEYLLRRTPRPDTAWNAAYLATLSSPSLSAEYLPLLVLMVLVLVSLLAVQGGLAAPGARVDWAVVLVNAAYVPLFLLYIRSTQWWPAIFGWSAIILLARIREANLVAQLPPRFAARSALVVGAAAVAATLGLSARTVRAAWLEPTSASWPGFGIGYVNPVAEADYLAKRSSDESQRLAMSMAGTRLYNIFDSGGYLLWRLYPAYLVMTDSRSFPYLAWFDDQYRFTVGASFADFVERYPADVAVIDHAKDRCQRNFLESPAWRPVFYGPTAGVFVRRGHETPEESRTRPAHGGIDRLENGGTALGVFEFAVAVEDYETAWAVLAQLEGPLRRHVPASRLQVLLAYRDARRALARGDFAGMRDLLRVGLVGRPVSDRDRQALDLLDRRFDALAARRPEDVALAEAALVRLEAGPGHASGDRGR